MRYNLILWFILFSPLILLAHTETDFKQEQDKQKRKIHRLYEQNRITEREFNKLNRAHQVILKEIHRANRDGKWTLRERKEISHRLEKTNRLMFKFLPRDEVYE